jgi:tetratricopeptide (TPR) repeat protein
MTEREMQILSSRGTIHTALHQHDEALHFFNLVETALKATEYLHDKSIKTRLFYNISRILTRLGRYEESTSYCQRAITWCIEEEHLWGLGELNYQIGYNHELVNDIEQAISYFNRALHMFELMKDEIYVAFISEKIEKGTGGYCLS